MFILRMLVAVPLFIIYLFQDHPNTPSDFKVERVKYSKAYIESYGISRHYRNIEIVGEGKKYSLYTHDEFIPKGMTLERITDLLNLSSEATIWVEEEDGLHIVRGIQTKYLNISPLQGIKFHESETRVAWWSALGCLGTSLFAYFYFKKYYNLDWKLNFKTYYRTKRR